MIALDDVGGVRVFGKGRDAWAKKEGRVIGSTRVVFDSDYRQPDLEKDSVGPYFALPCYRGKPDYEIHLLETGEAIVIKSGVVHLCTHHEGTPRVLAYEPVPAHRDAARLR